MRLLALQTEFLPADLFSPDVKDGPAAAGVFVEEPRFSLASHSYAFQYNIIFTLLKEKGALRSTTKAKKVSKRQII